MSGDEWRNLAATILIIWSVATGAASAYVIRAYAQARRTLPKGEVSTLFTGAALLCAAIAVCGVAMSIVAALSYTGQRASWGSLVFVFFLFLLLTVPIAVGTYIWRLRRRHP